MGEFKKLSEFEDEYARLEKECDWWKDHVKESLRMNYFSENRAEQEFKKLEKAMRKELERERGDKEKADG